jgi:hypothetical protein
MPISVTCACGQEYRLVDSLAGRKIRCKSCSAIIAVPGSNPLQASSSPPRTAAPTGQEPPAPVAPEAPPERAKRRKKKIRKKRSSYDAYAESDSLEDRLRDRSGSERKAAWTRSIKYFLFGLLLIGVAVFLFVLFTNLEEQGGRVRVHVIVAFLYKVTGKWGTTLIIGVLGLASCVLGVLNAMGIFVVVETED